METREFTAVSKLLTHYEFTVSGTKSRKRGANRISYKEDISSDGSSDEDESLAKKKKRKKASPSDSE